MNLFNTPIGTCITCGSNLDSTGKCSCLNSEISTLGTSDSSTYYIDTSGSTIHTSSSGYFNMNMDPSISIGEYSLTEESDGRLVLRDKDGQECMAFKDGVPMLGEKTIHQVILDVIEMYNGQKPLIDLLTDPDKGKRALGKEINDRREAKKNRAEEPTPE